MRKSILAAALMASSGLLAAEEQTLDVDVLVIGGTTRGIAAAKQAKAEGKRVFLATAHGFLGEDLAATLELGYDRETPPEDPLIAKFWHSSTGFAPFGYIADHDTQGIRWIFRNDRYDRIAEPGLPPSICDGVLYTDTIGYRCTLQKPAKISRVEVLVLEPEKWKFPSIMKAEDIKRLEQEKPGVRSVRTKTVTMTFLAGPRKGETVELRRDGKLADLAEYGWYTGGPVSVFAAELDDELSEVEVKVVPDPAAHHQLVSRIRFKLAGDSSFVTQPTPLKVKRDCDRELVEAGVDFITVSPVRRIFRKGDRISAVEIVNRSGRTLIRAKEKVVDATLYGTLGIVPAVDAAETFSRIILSDKTAPKATDVMKVEEFPKRFQVHNSNIDAKLYRCTLELPMKDGTFPSFARAEWEARELTATGHLADQSDFMVWKPSKKAIARGRRIKSGEIPEWGEYDVVVVGGGTSGTPAGLAAAREGAKTLIVEFCDVLGGVGTDGMIGGYFDGNHVGFTEEFKKANRRHADNRAQFVRAETWRAMCREAGADVWFGALGFGVVKDGNKVVGVEVSSPMGTGIVRAKCVIDGTGNSDVAAAAGAATDFIGKDEIAVQSAGESPQRMGRAGINSDFAYLNDADARDLWLFMLRARAGAPEAWDIAKLPDSRERRRIIADEQLTGQDVVGHRRFPDIISQALSRQDPHGRLNDVFGYISEISTEQIPSKSEPRSMFRVNVPLRCLLPKGLDHIAVVALGAGIHRDVVSISRMQADLMNLGYGAGIAAAMAAKNGGDFRTIDLKELRRKIVGAGNLPKEALDWEEEDITSDRVLAEAVKTVPDGYRGSHILFRERNYAKAIPLLKAAYAEATEPEARQTYALLLGLMGDATGVDTLVAVVLGKEKLVRVIGGKGRDRGTKFDKFDGGNAYSSRSRVGGMMRALARTKDPKAVKPLLRRLEWLQPDDDPREVLCALADLGAPEAAKPLSELLMKEGNHGFAIDDFRKLPPTGGYGVGDEFHKCFRELDIARALMACGDYNGIGRRVYEAYAKDPRGVLRAHARAVLGLK